MKSSLIGCLLLSFAVFPAPLGAVQETSENEAPAAAAVQDAGSQDGGAAPADPDYKPGKILNRKTPRIPDIRKHRIMDLPYVRTLSEVVEFDPGEIDIEADPIFFIGDEPVSRGAFRRRALMYLGVNEIDQHVTRVITRREIEKQIAEGADAARFEVDDSSVEARFQEQLDTIALRVQQSQGDPNAEPDEAEVARQQQEWLFQVESSVGLDGYRDLLRTDVQFEQVFLPWPEISPEEREAIKARNQAKAAAGESILSIPEEGDAGPDWLPRATWDAFMTSEQGRHMLGLVISQGDSGEPLPAIFKNSILVALRAGLVDSIGVDYFFDVDQMADAVFMTIGDEQVSVDDLWFMISNQIVDADVEVIARELVTLRTTRKALGEVGAWMNQEAWDKQWTAHNDEYKMSLLPLRNLIVFRGYTSMDRYREHYRYRASYDAWQRDQITEDEVLAHYQGGARLFFERGHVTLAPVFKPLDGDYGNAAFEAAAEEMGAFIASHDDWADVQAEYPFEYKDQGNTIDDQRMPARIGMRESELSTLVTGYNMTDDAFFRGVEGQIIGPWAQKCRRHAWSSETNAGVWAVKVLEYSRTGALPPFSPDDRNYEMAFDDYLTLKYLDFLQDNLASVVDQVHLAAEG